MGVGPTGHQKPRHAAVSWDLWEQENGPPQRGSHQRAEKVILVSMNQVLRYCENKRKPIYQREVQTLLEGQKMLIGFILYLIPGLVIVAASKSRGIFEDAVFVALWPYFLWRHYRRGV